MTLKVEALYTGGVLKPTRELPLRDKQLRGPIGSSSIEQSGSSASVANGWRRSTSPQGIVTPPLRG